MANLTINGASVIPSQLQELLLADTIVPGSPISYQICKIIYSFHPLGKKLAEVPIRKAQAEPRKIEVPGAPEPVAKQFVDEWKAMGATKIIANLKRTSRMYGVAAVICGSLEAKDANKLGEPLDLKRVARDTLYFNVVDPLNTAGSLVLNQDPNAPDFQKHRDITVSGTTYHRSRCCVTLNEEPIYIEYTPSAFGFVGRSVYQRCLYPLKSFVQTMITDDLVTLKAGVLIAKIKMAGSIGDRVMNAVTGLKRSFVKEAQTGNVISITPEEEIATLDQTNADKAMTTPRNNILANIASGADMPVVLVNDEIKFAEGFGEGTEDAAKVAEYISNFRDEMQPEYDFFDRICMYRAWNPEFYKTIQRQYPEYAKIKYERAFTDWVANFTATWPPLIKEKPSEAVEIDKVKLEGIIAALEVMVPLLSPQGKADVLAWLQDQLNELPMLAGVPLNLDLDELLEWLTEQQAAMPEPAEPVREPKEPRPFRAIG